MSLRALIASMSTFPGWGTAARRFAYRGPEIAEFRMTIAAIGQEKENQRSDAFDTSAINY